jgi:hypothetical protein
LSLKKPAPTHIVYVEALVEAEAESLPFGSCVLMQVALKWVAQSGMALVTRALNPTYLAEDIDLFDFEFSSTELALLNDATEPFAQPCLFCHGSTEAGAN